MRPSTFGFAIAACLLCACAQMPGKPPLSPAARRQRTQLRPPGLHRECVRNM